jgi:hypothetical protein
LAGEDKSTKNVHATASQFRLDGKDYKVVSPLVALPWCPLVMPAGCRIASCRPLIAPLVILSRQRNVLIAGRISDI